MSAGSSGRIVIRGARQHNLKGIDLELPRDRLIVITGLSGSGKSSLAFDTIYAEGQRRYVESLSAYARQFLEQMQKPEVESIDGLSPAISIEQRKASANPRSTVGTVTEIYDYLRLLFARAGTPHCHRCGREISRQSVQEIVDQVLALPAGMKIVILAPLVRGRKGRHQSLLDSIRRQGFVRVRVDGEIVNLEEEIRLDPNRKHLIEAVIDRLVVQPDLGGRLSDSVQTALQLGGGTVLVSAGPPQNRDLVFSRLYACPDCGISFDELSPRMFSFNSPYGACPVCSGLGTKMEVNPELVVPDPAKSLAEGAILPWSNPITSRRRRWRSAASTYYYSWLKAVGEEYGFDLDTPFERLAPRQRQAVLYGSGGRELRVYKSGRGRTEVRRAPFEGVIPNLERRYRDTESEFVRQEIFQKYISMKTCPECRGARLRPESLAVKVGGISVNQAAALSISRARSFFSGLKLPGRKQEIARELIKEINGRLDFLVNVGLGYLTLDRQSGTLAGGEAQRIRLATQIGSGLVGVLYILDEPSIGLHQRDNARLLDTLKRLRDLGNTVIVVEHDEATIRSADYIVDLGPGAGEKGGYLVVAGTLKDVLATPASLTGAYLRGDFKIATPPVRVPPSGRFLVISGAREHNLKNITVKIPLGLFCCVTGVSGSGKSTLIEEILCRALQKTLYRSKEAPGDHDGIEGAERVERLIVVDQSPIGRTPRSNPATYTGVFTHIRELFAGLPLSRMRGW